MYLKDRGKILGLFDFREIAAPSVPIPIEVGVVGIEGAAATVGGVVAVPSGGEGEIGLGRVEQAQKRRGWFFGARFEERGGSGGGGDGDGDGLRHASHHHVWFLRRKKGGVGRKWIPVAAAGSEWVEISFWFCFYTAWFCFYSFATLTQFFK